VVKLTKLCISGNIYTVAISDKAVSERWYLNMPMTFTMQELINQYVNEIKKIYGEHLRKVILYGSYARGDFNEDSDIDIMILLDMSDMDLKAYSQQLSYMTYDYNMDNDLDIKPIAKSEKFFYKWVDNYPFYKNVNNEGIVLYGAA
jgi:predicted nucleotidyltransferase